MALISADELSKREAYVKRIQNDQANLQTSLADLLERLQWTPQHFLEQDSAKVTCSYCPHHKMSVESLKKHEEVCYWIQNGYTIEELNNEPPSSKFFYENSKIMTIKLEKSVMNGILDEHHSETRKICNDRDVPQTLAASQVDLSRSERLAIYEHVVQQAKDEQRMQSMSEDSLLTVDFEALIKKSAKSKECGEPSSEAEKWAAMRDYKRRRQSYRAKNVHITKKTYTEIIREVIHNQVDLLQEGMQSGERGHENRNSTSKHDGDRKSSKRSSSDSKSGSSSRKRERGSPDRRKRETTSRSEPRAKDQKSPDRRRRDRDSPDHHSRKRDHNKSPESRMRRSRDSPEQRRNRSSPQSRKHDRKSPDARKRDKENPERRCRKTDLEESSTRMYDRENLEGVSRDKSSEHKKRKLECESVAERKSLKDRRELGVSPEGTTTSGGDKVGAEQFGNVNENILEETSSKWLSSNEDFNDSDGESSSHPHWQKSKKSKKKHKKHKH